MQFYAGFLICFIVTIVDSMPMMKSDTEGLPYPSRDSDSVRLFSEHNNDVLPNYSILTFNDFSDDEKMGDDNAILEGIWCQNVNSDESSGQWYAPYNVTVPVYSGKFGMKMPGPDGKVKNPETNQYNDENPIYSANFVGQTVLLRDRDSEFQLSESDEGLYYCTIDNIVLVVGLYTETTYNKIDGPVATDSIAYYEEADNAVIMTFNVSSGPPTNIACTGSGDFAVNESSMDVQRTVVDEDITAVRITLHERHEGIIQCNVSNERVTRGAINGTTATVGITSLTIRKESLVNNVSLKRLATGIAEYEISWSGSSPYYEISYYNPELNITNILGQTNRTSFIAKFNISSTTLLIIKFRVVGQGIPNDASMLPSDPSTSEQIQFGYPSITDLTLSAPSSTAVNVNWNHTSIDPLNGYNVKTTCRDFCDYEFNLTQRNYNAEQNSFALSGLSPGTTCNISVSAMYGEVEILSDAQVQRTLFSIPTLPPENLQVLSVTAYSIEVIWDDVLCSGQNGPITGYAVVYNISDSSRFSELIVEFNTSTTLENLLPYTTYLITITPINAVGEGNSSALLIQQTEESEPAQVSNLVGSAQNASSVILSWDEPSIKRGIITKYDIRYGESNSTEYVFGVNEQYYAINGLQLETKYSIAVRAHTVVGPGEWSEITVILLPEIQDILLIPVKDAINITWSSANGDLLKTIVQFSNSLDDHIYEIMLSGDTNSLILPLQLNSQSYNFTIFGVYLVDMNMCEGLHRSIMYNVDSMMQQNNCSCNDDDIQSEGLNPQKSDSTSAFLITAVSALSALVLFLLIIIVILIINIRKIRSKLTFTSSDPPMQLSQLRHISRDETYVDMKSQPNYENLRSSCEKEIDEVKNPQEASGVYEAIL